MDRSKFFYPFLLVLLWVVMLCIANPIGNFPLNDDWQYARPVWYLINKGYYFSPDAYSPIIISQVFWGALFCLPGGFSFNTLRVSTLVLSLAGILVFYFLLLKSSKNEKLSFLGALLLTANPLYFSLSNSFMTDVPFVAFSLFSIYFFFGFLESTKRMHLVVATLFAIAATLIRQFGVVIPIAFALVSIIKNRPKLMQWGISILPAIVTSVALVFGLLWLKHIGSELKPYYGRSLFDLIKVPGDIFDNSLSRSALLLLYSGFFLFPLLLYTTWNCLSGITKRQKIVMFIVVAIFTPLLLIRCMQLPYKNVFDTYGIGPFTLKGKDDMIHPNPDFPHTLLLLFQIVAFVGAIMLLIHLGKILLDIIRAYRSKDYSKSLFEQLFILFYIIGYAVLMFVSDNFFDRYLLIFIALSAILIMAGIPDTIKIKLPVYITTCIIIIGIGIFSAALTHDYISWNRSRWQASDYLTKDLKVSPHKMDGGYEFNGWTSGVWNQGSIDKGKSWWYVDDDEYVVAFHNFEGYTIIKQYSYQNYVPYEMKNIYILHRK